MGNKIIFSLILALTSLGGFSKEAKADYWLVIGSYRQGPGAKPQVSGITSPSLFAIPVGSKKMCMEAGKKIENEIIDTLSLARDKYPGSTVSLDALCKRFRIDNSKRVKHTALIDCDLLAKVYVNLIDQKEPTLNFNNQIIEIETDVSKVTYFKKIIKPTLKELEKHKEYLKTTIKKNYF